MPAKEALQMYRAFPPVVCPSYQNCEFFEKDILNHEFKISEIFLLSPDFANVKDMM